MYFKEREIWWCHVGSNIGSEEDGKGINFERPVLILKKINTYLFLGVPLTTKNTDQYFKFRINKNNYVIWNQIRTFSSKRLTRKMSILSKNYFDQLISILKGYLQKSKRTALAILFSEPEGNVLTL
jgi:mRNA-degrading endonuclease toxin of MazEF toxin-antitoxin module